MPPRLAQPADAQEGVLSTLNKDGSRRWLYPRVSVGRFLTSRRFVAYFLIVLYNVLPLALLIAIGAILAFIWATRSGQFDDLETPGMRVLHEDESTERIDTINTKSGPGSGNT
ncbi:MAG: cbb3-type cytochrome oxidase assembly protein CcoS [Planctomycetota bacterium]|nr:cbb3-type cytochrome oxidase assembly protein CcoS [Planctomycetota bacterium]